MKGQPIVGHSLRTVTALALVACAPWTWAHADTQHERGTRSSTGGFELEDNPATDAPRAPAAPQTLASTGRTRIEAEAMTPGGGHTGMGSTVVTLYSNGDSIVTHAAFP